MVGCSRGAAKVGATGDGWDGAGAAGTSAVEQSFSGMTVDCGVGGAADPCDRGAAEVKSLTLAVDATEDGRTPAGAGIMVGRAVEAVGWAAFGRKTPGAAAGGLAA